MKLKYSISKKGAHYWGRFKWVIIVYLLLWPFWYSVKRYRSFYANVFQEWGFERADFDNVFSSFTWDMFFWGTGFLSLAISTKLLRDEKFEVKVSSIANGGNVNKDIIGYFTKELEKLLSFNRNYKAVIEIQKISDDQKSIFIHVDLESQVVNMCENDKIPATISVNVTPMIHLNDEYGYIYHASIKPEFLKKHSDEDKREFKPHYFIPEGHIFDLKELRGQPYSKAKTYLIPSDGYAVWKLCYGVWLPINGDENVERQWFFTKFTKYIEDFEIRINNKLDIDIKYNYKYHDRANVDKLNDTKYSKLVKAGSSDLICSNLTFLKDDTFDIYFYI